MDEAERKEIFRRRYLARAPGDAQTKDYLAKKYLDSPSDDGKKKRKKPKSVKIKKGNIGIIDEDQLGWKAAEEDEEEARRRQQQENARLEAEAAAYGTGVFRGRTDGWQTVQEGDREQEDEDEETVRRPQEEPSDEEDEEDGPMVVEGAEIGATMSSGQRAGLLTKSDIRNETARAQEAERRAWEQLKEEETGKGAETVYRDATGRKVDPNMKRAEEERARKEEIERKARRMEWGKGQVQRNEAIARRNQLEEEKSKPMARYADDDEYNQEQKDKERWNDPAAGFLTKKTTSSKKRKGQLRPTFKGPWKPNRFMIPPGFRWDGVDRSNGYEDAFLLKANQKKSRAIESHQWSTEDM